MPQAETTQGVMQPPAQIKHISGMQKRKALGQQQLSWTHRSAPMPGCSSRHMGLIPPQPDDPKTRKTDIFLGAGWRGGGKGRGS